MGRRRWLRANGGDCQRNDGDDYQSVVFSHLVLLLESIIRSNDDFAGANL
jgi:hypothetical protein